LDADEFKQVSGDLELQLGKTNEFIDNLLQWAKLQLKGETFEPARLNLQDVTAETIELMKLEADKKNIKVLSEIPATAIVLADLNMIRTVLRNLLVNAVKFTPNDGTIHIAGSVNEHHVIISVSDTGVGIPVKNQERLFTMQSVTTLGTHQEKGTGLGLLLCKEFIDKNGGSIWVESEENKGATFSFSLPKVK
jgi:Signal transduction histidine kinase